MPLDPALQGMLDLLASSGTKPISEGTPPEARANFRLLTVDLRSPDSIVPVRSVEDHALPGPAGTLPVRIYRPDVEGSQAERPLPTVVFFHGGGFVIGDLDSHDNQCRWLCREVGAVVVSVDYRLAPEAPFPAAVEDCLAATRWAAQQAAELGGDPQRLVVAGDSAGGNLAAVVAQACRDEGAEGAAPALAAQLLIYPATDFVDDDGVTHLSRQENAEGFFLTAADMAWFSAHYAGASDPADPRLSPARGRLDGLPPAVVVTAEYDPLRDEGNAYARALADAGVPVRHHEFAGLIHGFFDLAALSPACEQAVRQTCADLRALLA